MKIKLKEVKWILLLYLAITLFILYQILNAKKFQIDLITYYLSYYIFGTIVLLDNLKNKNIFSLSNLFNIFGIAYSNFYIYQLIALDSIVDSLTIWIMNLSYLGMLSFNIFYYLSSTKPIFGLKLFSDIIEYKIKHIRLFSIYLFFLSIATELYLIYSKIGLDNYLGTTRGQKTLLMSDFGFFTFYKSTIPLVVSIFLLLYFKEKKKKDILFFILAFTISLLNSIVSGSRTELFAVVIPSLFLFNYFKKLNTKKIIIILMAFLVFLGAWKSLYSQHIEISFDSEFNTWYRVCHNVAADESQGFMYGESYVQTIVNLIVPFTNTESLSTWYVKTYEPQSYAIGNGRGFSGILEAYINFSYLGVILIYGFYGYLLRKIRLNNDFSILVNVCIMISIYQFFRSESYSLWKNMVWFRIYPLIIIFVFATRTVRRRNIVQIK